MEDEDVNHQQAMYGLLWDYEKKYVIAVNKRLYLLFPSLPLSMIIFICLKGLSTGSKHVLPQNFLFSQEWLDRAYSV